MVRTEYLREKSPLDLSWDLFQEESDE